MSISGSYPRALWRVLIHLPADGPTNMAIDEAIAEHVGESRVLPTLRFYSWEPPCLSLGYAQPAADADANQLRARGWNVVRRLTGGRAILHRDEVTYSVATRLDDPRVAGGVVESYRRLSAALILGLHNLGVRAEAGQAAPEAHRDYGPVCFEIPSDYEITAGGRKLLGSAQTRRSGVVLQHGALPLHGDLGRICDVLGFTDTAEREVTRARLLSRAITLEEALGHRLEIARVVGELMEGFLQALNLEFEETDLTPQESARAAELRATKYTSAEWTERH